MKEKTVEDLLKLELIFNKPNIETFSTVTGKLVDKKPTITNIWENIINPVRFKQAVFNIKNKYPNAIFVECNPHHALGIYISQMTNKESYYTSSRKKPENKTFLELIYKMQQNGENIKWQNILKPEYPHDSPNYQFEKTLFKLNEMPDDKDYRINSPQHPLMHMKIYSSSQKILYKSYININTVSFLKDHKVLGKVVVPATLFIELCLEVTKQLLPMDEKSEIRFSDFSMKKILPLTDDTNILFSEGVVNNDKVNVKNLFSKSRYSCDSYESND